MSQVRSAPPAWFRVVAIVLVLWGLAGCWSCYVELRYGADGMGPATDYDRALDASLPVWFGAVFIVAVGTGLFGSLALMMRSVFAIPLFWLSLVAVVIQFGYFFAATDVIAVKGVWTTYFPLAIFGIAVFQVWIARHARRRKWIG